MAASLDIVRLLETGLTPHTNVREVQRAAEGGALTGLAADGEVGREGMTSHDDLCGEPCEPDAISVTSPGACQDTVTCHSHRDTPPKSGHFSFNLSSLQVAQTGTLSIYIEPSEIFMTRLAYQFC